jgi:hypothetical protein
LSCSSILNIQQILQAPGKQLEQHEVSGSNDRHDAANEVHRHRARQHARLKLVLGHHDIDCSLTGALDADDSGERIVEVTLPYVGSVVKLVPERRLQDRAIDGQTGRRRTSFVKLRRPSSPPRQSRPPSRCAARSG